MVVKVKIFVILLGIAAIGVAAFFIFFERPGQNSSDGLKSYNCEKLISLEQVQKISGLANLSFSETRGEPDLPSFSCSYRTSLGSYTDPKDPLLVGLFAVYDHSKNSEEILIKDYNWVKSQNKEKNKEINGIGYKAFQGSPSLTIPPTLTIISSSKKYMLFLSMQYNVNGISDDSKSLDIETQMAQIIEPKLN